MLMTPTTAEDRKAGEALERVLGSRVFSRADRSRRFLRYLFECAKTQPATPVKEYTIAIDVFDRDKTYDPAVDATVRVEASRLRARLREYYVDEGSLDPVLLDVPKGSYRVVWRERTIGQHESSPAQPPAEPAQGIQQDAHTPASLSVPRRSLLWVGALALAIAVAAALAWRGQVQKTGAAAASVPTPPSLAILPISNRTGDATYDLLCSGLTDDLIRQLSQLQTSRLISRHAVLRTRPVTTNPLEVGRALGVGAVLSAELRRTPEHTVLAAELSQTGDGAILLDREYIVENADLQPVQAELQRDLVDKLHLEVSALDPGRSLQSITSSREAYREFLQGDALAANGEPGNVHLAMDHFQRAISLDPRFDLAWSALASAHMYLAIYFEAPLKHMPQARLLATTALRLNPRLGEAHGTLGLIHLVYDWNPSEAAAEMHAAGAQQAAMGVLTCTAHLLGQTGAHRDAEAMLSSMLTYDPDSAALIAELGCVDYYNRNFDDALHLYEKALAADPHSPMPYWGLGKTFSARHEYDRAVAILQSFRQMNGFEPPLLAAERGYAQGSAGSQTEALAVIATLTAEARQSYVDPYLIAVVYASMHDRDHTLLWLNKAADARSPFLISLTSEPKWEPWQSDPGFADILARMHTVKAP